MNKIYEQAKDLHVVGVYVYRNGEDGSIAYSNADCTELFKEGELKEAFIKGSVILVSGEKMIKAIGCTNNEDITFVDGEELITLSRDSGFDPPIGWG